MFFKDNFKLASICFITLLVSCGRSEPCTEATPILNFIAFPEAATDSIILSKYVKNSNFDSLVNSITISKSNSTYEKAGDTLHILTLIGGDYPLDIQFDYEVDMPVTNQLFRISNIVEEQTEIRVGLSLDKIGCVNPIKSYTLNDQLIGATSNIFYLKN